MSEEYWVNVFYSHQGQEKPDQPDNSWDPYNGGSPTSPDIPWWNLGDPGYIDWGTAGPSCYASGYQVPGDKYTLPVPAFYPGENDTVEWSSFAGWGPWAAFDQTFMEGDGRSVFVPSGEVFVVGSYSGDNFGKMDPPPSRSSIRGYMWFKVRGTGTVRFTSGVEPTGNWNWVGDPQSDVGMEWSGTSPEFSFDTSTYQEIGVTVPSAYIMDHLNGNGIFVTRGEVISGTIEIECVELRFSGECGYHRKAYSVDLSGSSPVRVQEFVWSPDWVPRNEQAISSSRFTSRDLQKRIQIDPAAKEWGTKLTLDGEVSGWARNLTQIGYDILMAGGQLMVTDQAQLSSLGQNYYASPSQNGAPPGARTPLPLTWQWDPFYPGTANTESKDSWSAVGRGNYADADDYMARAPRPETNLYGAYTVIPEGSAYPLTGFPSTTSSWVASRGWVQGFHYFGVGTGEYDSSQTPETFYALSLSTEPSFPDGVSYWPDFPDWLPQTPTYEPVELVVEISTTWSPGDPWPPQGTGQVVYQAKVGHNEDLPATATEVISSLPMAVTDPTMAMFAYVTSHGVGSTASASIAVAYRVLLPRYRLKIPVWEYLGG